MTEILTSIKRVKRHAKEIRKETGIPHHKALDMAAQDAGFKDWRDYLDKSKGRP